MGIFKKRTPERQAELEKFWKEDEERKHRNRQSWIDYDKMVASKKASKKSFKENMERIETKRTADRRELIKDKAVSSVKAGVKNTKEAIRGAGMKTHSAVNNTKGTLKNIKGAIYKAGMNTRQTVKSTKSAVKNTKEAIYKAGEKAHNVVSDIKKYNKY